MMQRQSTLQFWDDYHKQHDTQEWIAGPDDHLLSMIFDLCLCHRGDIIKDSETKETYLCTRQNDNAKAPYISILEIGCGTSTLVRDLKTYIEKRQESVKVFASGTDVSPTCIKMNCRRDKEWIERCNCRKKDHIENDSYVDQCAGLHYDVLNILEGTPSSRNLWDLILDKGCLDTFLFRSRHRGQNQVYPESVRKALDNIHTWLVSKGCYILISPRPKLKAVRDYAGFSSVKRYALPRKCKAALEGNKNQRRERNKDLSKKIHFGYLYVCIKEDDYIVNISDPFRIKSQPLPQNNDKCPHCQKTFHEFRKGETNHGGVVTFWTRQWQGHCIHCKGESF